jgi:fructose-1,6-bisphosphatase II
MDKIAVGPDAADAIDIDAPIRVNLRAVARAKGADVRDLTVVVLDRDRHAGIIHEVRDVGARLKLISDGDVAGAISVAVPDSGVDVLLGVGGTPEGVIAACALTCMGGMIQGRLWPRNDEERSTAIELGYDLDRVLSLHDLVSGTDVFFAATGVTDGDLVRGVRYTAAGAETESLVMRSRSGTIRRIRAQHNWNKVSQIPAVKY